MKSDQNGIRLLNEINFKFSGKYVIEKKVPDRKFNGVTKKFEKVLCVSHVLNKIPTKQPKHEKKIITIIK